ncbi:MAG: hypothetical protein ACK4TJ_00790 [Tabrizicola sp.]
MTAQETGLALATLVLALLIAADRDLRRADTATCDCATQTRPPHGAGQ